jgi:hypothetical protein
VIVKDFGFLHSGWPGTPKTITITAAKDYNVDMTGTQQIRAELAFPAGTTSIETQNGRISASSAKVKGNLAGLMLPVAPDVLDRG